MALTKETAPTAWSGEINSWLDYLTASGSAVLTVDTRRRKIIHLAKLLKTPPTELKAGEVVRIMAEQPWKPETRRAYAMTARLFFRFTGRRDIADAIPRVRRPMPKPRPCPDNVIERAYAKANTAERIMLRLGAECGLRRAEIAAVQSSDVMATDEGPELVIVGKGDKQRIVPLSQSLADMLTARTGWVFPGRWSGHVEASYIGKHLARLLQPYTAHSLRHRYATTAWCATHDLLLVSKLLGHTSVETTERYVAMPDDRLRVVLPAVSLL